MKKSNFFQIGGFENRVDTKSESSHGGFENRGAEGNSPDNGSQGM